MSPKPWIHASSEIEQEFVVLDALVADIEEGRDLLSRHRDRIHAAFVAHMIHGFYTGVEGMFERIARALDDELPKGESSHVRLLESAALDLPGLRPAILRRGLIAPLRHLLQFRHFFRHAYAVDWDFARLGELSAIAITVWPEVRRDLDAFRRHLLGPQP